MTAARLKGLVSALTREQRIVRSGDPVPDPDFDPSSRPIEIRDARVLQTDLSEEACFGRHGFALLSHATTVRRWSVDPSGRDDITEIYRPEINRLARERLFPGRRIEIDQSLGLVCRGGEHDPAYATSVHQDFGLTVDDLALNVAQITGEASARALQARYAGDDVVGCVAISFWRTIGMLGPLRHMPLALCDAGSVDMADVIADDPSHGGARYHIGLRFNPAQRWYHYPGMQPDELLAFKLFACSKDDPGPERLRSVFHAAFDDPDMPPDALPRRSCEHRVIVMVLAD